MALVKGLQRARPGRERLQFPAASGCVGLVGTACLTLDASFVSGTRFEREDSSETSLRQPCSTGAVQGTPPVSASVVNGGYACDF